MRETKFDWADETCNFAAGGKTGIAGENVRPVTLGDCVNESEPTDNPQSTQPNLTEEGDETA